MNVWLSSLIDAWSRGRKWFLRGLATSLPAWLMNMLAGEQRELRVYVDDDQERLELMDRLTGHRTSVAPEQGANFRSLPTVLVAPRNLVLSKNVKVPAGYRTSATTLIEHNLSVWTPFTHSDVYAVGRLHSDGPSTRLTLSCARRDEIDPLLRAAGARRPIDRLELSPDAPPLVMDRRRQSGFARQKWLDAALLFIAVALIFLAYVVMDQRLDSEIQRLSEIRRNNLQTLKQIHAVREDVSRYEALIRAVSEQRSAVNALEVLGNLAEILPEETQIQSFEWSATSGRLVLLSNQPLGKGLLSEADGLIAIDNITTSTAGSSFIVDVTLSLKQ